MRSLVCFALFAIVTVAHAQSDTERRVEIVLLDGTRVEGKLLEFGQRIYRVRIGSQVLEFSEKEVAEVRFNATARGREEELARTEAELRRDPQDAAALTRRADLLAQLAREDEARRAYEAALKEMEARGPDERADTRNLQDQGRALMAVGRVQEAIATFRRALDLANVSRSHGTGSAAVQAQLAEELARAEAEFARAAALAEARRGSDEAAAAGGPPVVEVSATSPTLYVLAPIAADGTVTIPWAGALPATGAADGSLRNAIEAAWRKRLPAGTPVEGLTVAGGSAGRSPGATLPGTAAPYSTLQLGVSGHPDWATNLIQIGSGDAKYEVVGLGEIAVAKGATWAALLGALYRAVRARDPQASVWVRVLPHPWLSPVSMAELLDHVWSCLAADAEAAASVTHVELHQATLSLEGEVTSLAVASRMESLLSAPGKLQVQLEETHPIRRDFSQATTYRYRISGGLLTAAGDAWGAEVSKRRAGTPEAPFRMGDYLDRLQRVATASGVALGGVSGQQRPDGGTLRVTFTGGDLRSTVASLVAFEHEVRNLHTYRLSVRSVRTPPVGSEWQLEGELHAGFGSDPWEGVDPR